MKTANTLRLLTEYTPSQRGLISAAQADRLGIDRVTLTRLTKGGTLTRVRRGVYALPESDLDSHQEIRAAWIATDPSRFADERAEMSDSPVAALSTAALIHGTGNLVPQQHIFISSQRKQSRQSDIRYLQRDLDPEDRSVVDGITTTGVTRTIADLAAARLDGDHLADVVRDAAAKDLAPSEALAAALEVDAHAYGFADGGAALTKFLASSYPGLPAAIESLTRAARIWEAYEPTIKAAVRTLESSQLQQVSKTAATAAARSVAGLPRYDLRPLTDALSQIRVSPVVLPEQTRKSLTELAQTVARMQAPPRE